MSDGSKIEGSDAAVIVASKALSQSGSETYVLGADYWGKGRPVPVEKHVEGMKSWLAEMPGAAQPILDALAKGRTVFWSPLAPASLFVTTERVIESDDARVLARGEEIGEHTVPATPLDQRVTKALAHVRIAKTDEERFVFGVVLEPNEVDSQGDFESPEDIRDAAHTFMEHFAQLGKQHSEIVTGKLKVLESYVAPADFDVGDEKVKKGTWMMAIRVVDDDLWESVKKGDFTGFSIGGFGHREPADAPDT